MDKQFHRQGRAPDWPARAGKPEVGCTPELPRLPEHLRLQAIDRSYHKRRLHPRFDFHNLDT